jgi:hypothetical protein
MDGREEGGGEGGIGSCSKKLPCGLSWMLHYLELSLVSGVHRVYQSEVVWLEGMLEAADIADLVSLLHSKFILDRALGGEPSSLSHVLCPPLREIIPA